MSESALPAYVMAYFTDELEAFFLATSTDGVRFADVNGGSPLLVSSLGSRTMRDPFVGRDADGVFHLVATDGWQSRSIVHSTSTDLLNWTEPELVGLMESVDGTLNTWAPEFFLTASGEARLLWSSTVSSRGADRSAPTNSWRDVEEPQEIWQSTTRDFRTFSPPSVYFAPGYTVIDASAYVDADFSLMTYKDERGENREGTTHKDIHVIALDADGFPTGASWPAGTPSLVEGPNVYRVEDELRMIYDLFTTPDYAAMASTDGRTWTPTRLITPPMTKHASVLALTAEESAALGRALQDR